MINAKLPSTTPERLFIGVPLTEDARRAIATSLPKNLPGKPVLPENWHFTLRFLGPTSADARDQIVKRLGAAACGSPFNIRFAELGAFPNPSVRASYGWASTMALTVSCSSPRSQRRLPEAPGLLLRPSYSS